MAVSKSLRYEIFRRDNHACRYCGVTSADAKLTIDHVVPTALGGSDQPDNLVTACADCNAGKKATPPDAALVADVAQDALRWSAAMKRAAFLASMDREYRDEMVAQFSDSWNGYTQTSNGETVPRPSDWARSVEQFTESGLDLDTLEDAINIAMTAPGIALDERWRYFCGVAWKKLRAQQDTARQLIDQGFV